MQNVAQPSFPLICPGGHDLEKLKSCSCPPLRHAGCADESFQNAFAVAELMQNGVFTLPFACLPLPSSLRFRPAPCAAPAPSLTFCWASRGGCGPGHGLKKITMEEMPALNSSARAVSGSVNSARYSVFSQISAALLSDHQPKQITLHYHQTPPCTSAVEGLGSCSLTHTVWEKVIISATANWTSNNLSLRNSNDAPLKIYFN